MATISLLRAALERADHSGDRLRVTFWYNGNKLVGLVQGMGDRLGIDVNGTLYEDVFADDVIEADIVPATVKQPSVPVDYAYTDPHELIRQIDRSSERPYWAWWQPSTDFGGRVYHVTLLSARASDGDPGRDVSSTTFRALVVSVDPFGEECRSIVVPRPQGNHDRYTAHEWVRRGLASTWWTDLAPVVHAIGWTRHHRVWTRPDVVAEP